MLKHFAVLSAALVLAASGFFGWHVYAASQWQAKYTAAQSAFRSANDARDSDFADFTIASLDLRKAMEQVPAPVNHEEAVRAQALQACAIHLGNYRQASAEFVESDRSFREFQRTRYDANKAIRTMSQTGMDSAFASLKSAHDLTDSSLTGLAKCEKD